MLAFALACSGAWAYETGNSGADYNDHGVRCWVDRDNNIQYIDVKTAGGFADFVTNGDFNEYFNNTKDYSTTVWKTVKLSGSWSDTDLAAINTSYQGFSKTVVVSEYYSYEEWYPGAFYYVELIDFTDVTTAIKPAIKWDGYQGTNHMVIWPAATDPTTADLATINTCAAYQGITNYAYYTDNNKEILKITSACADNDLSNIFDYLKNLLTVEALSFDALEIAYGWNGSGYVYTNAASTLLANIGKLPIVSLNLQGTNISSIGTDLTALNTATNYIILPCNNSSAYNSSYDFATFTYNDNVCVVASYISNTSPYGNGGDMAGHNYSVKKDGSTPTNPDPEATSVTLTYVHKTNTLAGGAPYLPSVMQNADKVVICGILGEDDVTDAIDHMTCPYIDLSKATLAEGVDIATSYANTTTQWLAVPNNTRREQVDALYSALNTNTGFRGVVGFTTEALEATDDYQAVPTNTLITYTKEQGSVYNLVFMIEEANTGNFASGVSNLIMSGNLNAYDICNSTQGAAAIKQALYSDGHLYNTDYNAPDGLTQVTSGALDGATIATIDFSGAIFDQPTTTELTAESCTGYFTDEEKANLVTDMNFLACGIVPSTSLILPTDASQIVIPAHFMSAGISEICIPYNFQYIMDYAFNACGPGLQIVTTTADPEATDLVETEVDHGSYYLTNASGEQQICTTYTIGSKVKYIAVGAFDTNTTCPVGDVYVLAKTAPICEPNAFCSVKLLGNNGFNSSHPISRSNYMNGSSWIAVLHFPNTLDDDAKKGYTDIEREYWYTDETGAVDGEGNLLRWPCHSEFARSWNQANLGYTWSEWDDSREIREGYGTYGQVLVTGNWDGNFVTTTTIQTVTQSQYDDGTEYNEVSGSTTVTDKHADCDECGFSGNIGWHQFLLASPGYFYEETPENYVETPWYTFCIPFNMTLDELSKYLGVPSTASANAGAMPEVRTLKAVKRNTESNHVDIIISKNLVAAQKDMVTYGQETGENMFNEAEYVAISVQKDGEDVYLKGGYPYFVKGWIPEGVDLKNDWGNNLGSYVLAKAGFQKDDLGNVIIIDASATEVADANVTATKMYAGETENFIAMPHFNHTVDAQALEGDNVYFYGAGQRTLATGVEEDLPYLYNFMGNFEQEDYATSEDKAMPQYSYYMASGKIYRYKTVKSNYIWKPYICMIGHGGVGSVYQKVISNVVTYHSAYADVADDQKWGADEYGTGESAGAGTYSLIFDEDDIVDGGATEITNLNGVDIVPVSGPVYNLNGQYMGTSLNKLAKGVYVVNGKKFVVK